MSKRQLIVYQITPSQKVIVVRELQRLGNKVAVVGDGINDLAAIKAADIGISMG